MHCIASGNRGGVDVLRPAPSSAGASPSRTLHVSLPVFGWSLAVGQVRSRLTFSSDHCRRATVSSRPIVPRVSTRPIFSGGEPLPSLSSLGSFARKSSMLLPSWRKHDVGPRLGDLERAQVRIAACQLKQRLLTADERHFGQRPLLIADR